jgi:predicted component of type VI protein secretion system
MSARLVCLDGHPDIPLRPTMILVGRHTHCDVRVESARVSRHHCCMVLEEGHLIVRDLDSTNGTWVNGARVSLARMAPGDELALGQVRYRFESGPSPGCPLPPRPPGPEPQPAGGVSSGLSTYEIIRPPRESSP